MGTHEALDGTLDPAELQSFLRELEDAGFRNVGNDWIGPLPASLERFTHSREMKIRIRDGWPYQPPHIEVEGIDSWHANQDSLCLWQSGDDTRRWATLEGIRERIDEWAVDAAAGFPTHGVGLDAHLYFETPPEGHALIDVAALIGNAASDGQSDRLSWTESDIGIFDLEPGPFKPGSTLPAGITSPEQVYGLWFYRQEVANPPRNLAEFRAALTRGQMKKFDAELSRPVRHILVFVLVWKTAEGLAALILNIETSHMGNSSVRVLAPHPKGQSERLLRAGPESSMLRGKSVVLFGVGAIGSWVASLLARSGLEDLTLIDGDSLWPVNMVRHAAAVAPPGWPKADAMARSLRLFDWAGIKPSVGVTWHPQRLRDHIIGADLVVDATGDLGFAELLARIAKASGISYVTTALYRGGSIARIRRQAKDDRPISTRHGIESYPEIPAEVAEVEYLGLETGCAAPINNAPPAACAHAAALTTEVCIDLLNGRMNYGDEVIEIFRKSDAPFDRPGTVRPEDFPPKMDMTESAQLLVRSRAAAALPDETGGVLVGLWIDGRPLVVQAIEIPSKNPSPGRYEIAKDVVPRVVEDAAKRNARLGYLGEWHSHPTDHGPSSTDLRMMIRLAADPDTGDPLMILARPQNNGSHMLDAYVTVNRVLVPTSIAATGEWAS